MADLPSIAPVPSSSPKDGHSLRIESAQVFQPLLAPTRYKGAWGGEGPVKIVVETGMTWGS